MPTYTTPDGLRKPSADDPIKDLNVAAKLAEDIGGLADTTQQALSGVHGKNSEQDGRLDGLEVAPPAHGGSHGTNGSDPIIVNPSTQLGPTLIYTGNANDLGETTIMWVNAPTATTANNYPVDREGHISARKFSADNRVQQTYTTYADPNATDNKWRTSRTFTRWRTGSGASAVWSEWSGISRELDRGRVPSGTDLTTFATLANVGTWYAYNAYSGQITGWPDDEELLPCLVTVEAGDMLKTIRITHLADGSGEEWVGTVRSTTWTGWRQVQADNPLVPRSWSAGAAGVMTGPVYNEGSPALLDLRNAVRRGLAGEDVNLVCVGDSKTRGSQSSDVSELSYPAQMEKLLGARPGVIFAGAHPNTPDLRWSFTEVDETQMIFAKPTAPTATAQITVDTPHTGATFVLSSTVAGTITATVDGGTPESFTVQGDDVFRPFTINGLPDTAHTVVFDLSGLGTGWTLRSYRPLYSTPGLTITNAGVGGSQARHWRKTPIDGIPNYFGMLDGAATLDGITFDAATVGLGTNNPTDTANIAGAYDDILAEVGTVLAVSPGAVPASREVAIAEVYATADRLDLPLVDNRLIVGNQAMAAARGLAVDNVHESAKGYAVEASVMAKTIKV